MFIYGMGLTQHEQGVETVRTLINLALMRGNVGRPGAGICPVRGHSNVQGQRTVGITEKPTMVPADKIKQQFGIDVPESKGLTTVEACAKIIDGSVRAMVLLGGNLVRAVPEHRLVEPAWHKLRLTVNILITSASLVSDPKTETKDPDVVQLITLRSNGQFNTTIYSYDDRFRGIYGSRQVVLMNPGDIERFALKEGAMVTLATAANDGVTREVGGLRIVAYDIPQGCIAGYYPECNPLLPLWHHEKKRRPRRPNRSRSG
jgi:anaerobic selenocysteine-containing dehydrogenase